MLHTLRYLLLQVRKANDPIRTQEVHCFARSLSCTPQQILVHDLLSGRPSRQQLDAVDMVLLGGSGDYSVVQGGPWLEPALDAMRDLHDLSKPTFASCWGFQAMARALGGQVVTDFSRAELGTLTLHLTADGQADPLFNPLGASFLAQMGHQDIVDRLPPDAVLLASSNRVENQAFRFAERPIYCTQFHPELDLADLLERLRAYPTYVEQIAGVPFAVFVEACAETPEANTLLTRFVKQVFAP